MPSTIVEPLISEAARAELQAVLQSPLFIRSPGLAHLLSYLCEKLFAGESDQIKEYSVAVDVFGRRESFDQDSDSIVRVQANRLRKRLAEYYSGQGARHSVHISVPVGQYIPVFEERALQGPASGLIEEDKIQPEEIQQHGSSDKKLERPKLPIWMVILTLAAAVGIFFVVRPRPVATDNFQQPLSLNSTASTVGLPVGDEVRILAGSSRSYVDRSGKLWSPDEYFSGGSPVRAAVQHIWRTQDPAIYRCSRQGDFRYDIPLKPGTYELHLHFAETFYGPEDAGGGGEGSRIMDVSANGKPLLNNFDVIADASDGRTADVKVFTDIKPAEDGFLHLIFSSAKSGRGMISGIEIVPGNRGAIRPVRIVARDVPYYSNDSQWWSSDVYFKGGQIASSEQPARETDDPELYETERWGHFSYAIPVTPGKYTINLHFIDRAHRSSEPNNTPESAARQDGARIFDVFCNGRAILRSLNVVNQAGEDHPLVEKVSGVEPNAQGKLVLQFVPLSNYLTLSVIEVLPQ